MILNNAKDIKLGSTDVDRVYLGTEIVWERHKGLPSNYQQVEYLRSTGTQYIDTGYKFNKQYVYEIDASIDNINNNQLWGMYYGYNHSVYVYDNTYFVKGDQYVPSYNGANTSITGNTRCKFNFNSITKTCDITGEGINQHYDFSNFSPISSVYKFLLFATWSYWSDAFYAYGQGKIYGFKLYQTINNVSTLVCNLIPCYRKNDSKPGMYDMVTNTFYVNNGTGEFYVGPDVVDEYNPVYVIAGSSPNLPMLAGTQYADIPSTGKSSTPFIGHRKYYSSDDTPLVMSDVFNGLDGYIEVQEYGGAYHDISIFDEWSAKIKLNRFASYSTPGRGWDILNAYDNWNMHIYLYDYWGVKLYIIPQDLIPSPIVYNNPFNFTRIDNDRLATSQAPDGYSNLFEWVRNDGEGREFWLGVKDGYFYVFIEGYPICKQVYSKPIDKLNVGYLYTRDSGYYSGNGILKYEFYNKFIFPVPDIPPMYHKVEYLQSDGYQYINTGLTFNTSDYHYIVDCSIDNHNGNQMFGMKANYDHGVDVYNDHYQLIDTNTYIYDTSIIAGERVTFTIDKPTKTIYADTDTIHESYTSPGDFFPGGSVYPVIIFGCWSSWSDRFSAGGAGKMYSFKYYSNNELKIDLIPCVRESDNVPGMYDLLTGNFLTNSGSGNFTAGPIIY